MTVSMMSHLSLEKQFHHGRRKLTWTTTTNQCRIFTFSIEVGYLFIYLFMKSIMDFTSKQNTENSNPTNTSGKLFNIAGEPLALSESAGNQV